MARDDLRARDIAEMVAVRLLDLVHENRGPHWRRGGMLKSLTGHESTDLTYTTELRRVGAPASERGIAVTLLKWPDESTPRKGHVSIRISDAEGIVASPGGFSGTDTPARLYRAVEELVENPASAARSRAVIETVEGL